MRPIPLQARAASNEQSHSTIIHEEATMGKYFLGWLLGVPVVVLVIVYLIFH